MQLQRHLHRAAMLTATHPVYFLLVLSVALASVWLIDRWFPVSLPDGRVTGIDGLRGYLAAGVFAHHACIWYFFLRSGDWALPPSLFYTQLGRTSVGLFFMVTGFLFMDRLLARSPAFVRFSRTTTAGIIAAIALLLSFGIGADLSLTEWLLAMTVAFTLIANGNTLFGLLSCRLSRVFGEITYSVYLLHGMTLFVVFRFIAGIPAAARFEPATHWALTAAATPALIAIAFLSWRNIEQPCLRYVGSWSDRLRTRPLFLAPLRRP